MPSKVIHQDDDLQVFIGDPVRDAPIQMCQSHWKELCDYQLSETQLEQCVKVIFTLASRTLGTVNLVKYRCPVCGLRDFDYLQNTVWAVVPERQNGN